MNLAESGSVEFVIKESFGPFEECENFKLLMTTSRSGLILMAIGNFTIYGIKFEFGEVLFEVKVKEFEIKKSIEMLDGCLLVLDNFGRFKLIEIFHETGQVLATWQMKCESKELFKIDSVSIGKKFTSSKFNLIVKLLPSELNGTIVSVFTVDLASEFSVCSFRHWILNNQEDDKILPIIVTVFKL